MSRSAVYNLSVAENESSEIIIISEPIPLERIAEMAAATFGDMVKGVVDIELRLLAVGGVFTLMRKQS